MATIGYTGIGGSSDATAENWLNESMVDSGVRYTAASGDTVTKVWAYGGGTGLCEVGVYEFSGGVPTTLVGSAQITIGETVGWYSANVNWSLTNGVSHCVAIDYQVGGGTTNTWTTYFDNNAGSTMSTGSGSDALPGTWSQNGTTAYRGSWYAEVTAGGGVTGTVAETLDAFTSSASGTVHPVGTVAATLGAFTSSASGTVQPPPYAYVVGAAKTAAISASQSPSLTFDSAPLEGDYVIMWPSSTTTGHTITEPSGWTNPLGAGVDVESDAHQICCVWHKVTSGEAGSSTVTFTATNLYGATTTGNVVGCVVRNADATTFHAAANSTFSSTNAANPHVLAGITDPNTNNGLVLSAVAKDGTGAYSTQPTGWTFLVTSNTNQGKALLSRDTLASDNTAVDATNITPSAGDEYASITVIAKPSTVVTGTVARTLGSFTSTASGWVEITGTVAETLDPFTSSASGTHTPPAVTGTVAATLGSFTSTASGWVEITGTVARTLGSFTSTAIGSTIDFPYPASRSGRKWLDQNGNPYLLKALSSWGMPWLSTTDITTAMAAVEGRGFNAILVQMFGYAFNGTWTPYDADNGDDVFTGTPYRSSLGAAWNHMDHIVSEATDRGITVVMSLYTAFGTTGPRADLESAYTASSTNTYNFGVAVATRYASYPNIVWHLGADDNWGTATTIGSAVDSVFDGIRDTEGSTHRLIVAEPNNGSTTNTQWGMTGFTNIPFDADSVYDYDNNVVENWDAVYDDTSYPVWDCEPPYVDSPHAGAANRQQLRERIYSTFIRGGIGINYGHESWWNFDNDGIYGSTGVWETAITDVEFDDAEYAWSFIDYCADTTWAPDGGTFLTTGVGTGDTKAASGFSNTAALVYFPSSRTVVVDTTVISGTSNVRLRWFDPTNGSYTSIAASEAQQSNRSVTYPTSNSNSAGADDWVLVVDISTDVSGTVTETLDAFTSTASGWVEITGTVTETLDAFTSTASGWVEITGTVAETLDAFTSTASGTSVEFTGTVDETLDAFTSTASGWVEITGTVAETLDPFTSTASGTSVEFVGSLAETLDPFTSAAAGTSNVPYFDQWNNGGLGAGTRSPSVTFDVAPLENDVVIMFVGANATGAAITVPSGWENVLGGTTVVDSGSHTMVGVVHAVTAAEAGANTVTFTATNLFNVSQTGGIVFGSIRNADPTDIIDNVGASANSATPTTSCSLESVTPLGEHSLIVGGLFSDGNSGFNQPGGWSQVMGTTTTPGRAMFQRNTLSTANTATGTVSVTGTVSDQYTSITVAINRVGSRTGTSAQTLGEFTSSASGTSTSEVTGTVAATLDAFTATASGWVEITGTVAETLDAFTSSATGQVVVQGTVAVTLSDFTSTASGWVEITGTSAQTLGPFTSVAAGTSGVEGTVAETLDPFTSSAAGTVVAITGTVAVTLVAFTSSASGESANTGTVAETLDPFTSTASGSVVAITGTVAVTLGAFTSTASGTSTNKGTAAVTLGSFTATASGWISCTGTVAETLDPFVGAAAGNLGTIGAVMAELNVFVCAASGTVQDPYQARFDISDGTEARVREGEDAQWAMIRLADGRKVV